MLRKDKPYDFASRNHDDTRLAVGGEAMQEATQVYNYVKTAAKTTPGLKPIADQLGKLGRGSQAKEVPGTHGIRRGTDK
uniref:Uncharacterized protein n=1 Tax=Candidatus Kentrum sp. LPFa TaxID=2126335 RepID=A0A450XJS8_9GAMM|nr:MAG: hypothetical protein BECKLPF1236A_GA0070988_1009410 [Candidatus Kentron sp. LPFa]VFK29580.1 MAG: hypothetical protein BECKLPF1236C_GA0070990_1009010 [Candidatus Kentron sp. LPFa]